MILENIMLSKKSLKLTLYDSIYMKSSEKANLEAESRSVITRILGAGEMVYKCQSNRYRAFFWGGGEVRLSCCRNNFANIQTKNHWIVHFK